MAITNFIPEIWSAAVAEALLETSTVAPVCNRSYEGDARRGNQVHITGVIPPNIVDYKAAGRVTNAQDLSDAGATLLIDQEKAYDFHVDDVDAVQAAGSFTEWTTAAGRRLSEDADAYIVTQAIAGGTNDTAALGGATALNADPDGVATHNAVRDFRKFMNKAKVPQGERYLLMNPEFEANFLSANAKITSVDTSGSPAGFREAVIGRYLGFTLVSTTMFPAGDFPKAIAFWRPALAYVSQIDETETMRSHTKFADRIRGLHVYGAKVVDFYATAVRLFIGAGA